MINRQINDRLKCQYIGKMICRKGEKNLNGPMNISYKRRESAPYCETTSSGLTTFPLLLLILCARLIKRIEGLSFSTNESPDFVTYFKTTMTDIAMAFTMEKKNTEIYCIIPVEIKRQNYKHENDMPYPQVQFLD